MGLRVCKNCNVTKSFDEFGYVKKSVRGVCKACRAAEQRLMRITNPDWFREQEYKKKYKITLKEYNSKLESQNGVCAICKGTWSRVLVVDHDHSCCPGEKTCGNCLRGLLCGSCNAGLGWFKNSPEIMRAAIEYINTAKAGTWN